MDNKKDGFGLPISSIFVVMTILGAIWFYNSPLKGIRPTADKISEQSVLRIQDVPARLWQDPFAAINEDGKKYNSVHDISEIGISEMNKDGNELIILGVMVSGGPYAEDAEWRLRMRYAAISALGRLNYQPEDSQHIGYFNFQLDGTSASNSDVRKKQLELKIDIEPDLSDDEKQLKFKWDLYHSSNSDGKKSLRVPFEWFKKEEPSRALLLLWLKDDAFYKNPLQELSNLVKMINSEINELTQKTVPKIKIFGPTSSTTLKTMIEDVKNNTNNSSLNYLNNVQIYSPFATADDPQLLGTSTDKNISEYLYKNGNVHLVRTIGNDKNLLKTIIEELGQRKVGLIADEKCHVALIREWDTFYSRSMRRSFITLLRRENKQVEDRIHLFSYLRGIDGQLPGEIQQKPDKAKHDGQSRGNDEDSENNDMYRPTGCNQYDYLLRLTRQIQAINEDLRREDKGEIKAIGVLGSDVYDKLLVLRAMRQQFPTAVFFTTDLDACLLQPSEFKWSRNLVVASNFGLRLHDELQGDIPAFRDNYQTSLFFSVLVALSQNKIFEEGKSPSQDFINKYLIPRIFEVGRNGAVDLTLTDGNPPSDTGNKLVIDGTPILDKHLCAHLSNTSFCCKWKVFYICIFFALLLIYISSDTVKDYFYNNKNRFMTISVIIIGFVLWYALKDTLFKEEPFSLFDGISIWPTEVIRLTAAILSFFSIVKFRETINSNNEILAKQFAFPSIPSSTIKGTKWALLFPYWWGKTKEETKGCEIAIHSLWQEYLKLGWFRYRFGRTAIFAICFFLLYVTLLSTNVFSGLYVPARGDLSYIIDRIILIFAVVCLQFLLFFVVDAARLCRRFIQLLPDSNTRHEYTKCVKHKYQKINLIAECTEAVCRLNYYPFLALFLMIMARNTYFDRWNMSFLLLSIFVVLGIYSLSCNLILHREAKRAKEKSIAELKEQLILLCEGGINIKRDKEIEQIKVTMDAIASIQKGAFRPFSQQPIIRAALLPFGGAGSLVLIDYLARWQ